MRSISVRSVVSLLLFSTAIIAVLIVVAHLAHAAFTFEIFVYLFTFMLLPLFMLGMLATGRRLGLWMSLFWSLLLCVRGIGQNAFWVLGAPISLGIPVGDFSLGGGWLVDPLFIMLALLSCWGLYRNGNLNRKTSSYSKRAD
ncbi:hypothetical protein [Shewanella waksmanii]|uniref:hypothetical protein n=1 Tax=Shewanella waksmanii TaxID=213783 RepID=UPI00373690AC